MSEPTPHLPPSTGNSRETTGHAGWDGDAKAHAKWRGMLNRRKRNRWGNFTWISPGPLLASMNDLVAKGMDDLINQIRPRWVAQKQGFDPKPEQLEIDDFTGKPAASLFLLGDPGEQDASQYAVVAPMLAQEKAKKTDFMVIASDVIYPAGDINDYIDGFYLPYRRYKQPIFAIPGNHDWYDGLNGFMWHFCGAEALPPIPYRAGSFSWKERLARLLWRKPSPPKLPQLLHERGRLSERRRNATQPGPYFTIRTRELLIVCIDTGITGKLDRQQGDWLCKVSCLDGPKLLLTGKPIYVDGEYHPGEIDWGPEEDPEIKKRVEAFRTVDDIVREKDHDYRAVVGGDVHNYQRYEVEVIDQEGSACDPRESTRTIQYMVSGGAGAYLSATHRIGRVDLEPEFKGRQIPVKPVTENEFFCYPLRGDSLARFVRRSSVGFALLIAAAVVIVVGALCWFFGPLDHGRQPVAEFGDREVWKAMVTVVGADVAAVGALRLGIRVSNKVVARGYRTMTATVLTASIGALLVGAVMAASVTEWEILIWKMSLASPAAVIVPIAGLVAYFLLRDFVAPSVRLALALAIPLALAIRWVKLIDEPAVEAGLAALALWVAIAGLGGLRQIGAAKATKRVRTSRLLPPFLALGGLVAILVIARDDTWIPVALAIALATTLTAAALVVLLMGYRGLLALRWLIRGRIDPDETAKWLAKEIGVGDPVRPSAARKDLKVTSKTKRLASFLHKTKGLNGIISEVAEATGPPFFKHFLRLDIEGSELKITAFGVSGLAADQENPTVEDEVPISLEPLATEATPEATPPAAPAQASAPPK